MSNKELTPEEIANKIIDYWIEGGAFYIPLIEGIKEVITHERKLRQEAESKLKLAMNIAKAARQYINDGYPHKASYPYNNFSDMELAIEVLDKWVGNE